MGGQLEPCPYGDGQCFVPDTAIAFTTHSVSLVTGQARDNLLIRLDTSEAPVEELGLDVTSLLAFTLGSLAGTFRVAQGRGFAPPQAEQADEAREFLAAIPEDSVEVLVICEPCKHACKRRIPRQGA